MFWGAAFTVYHVIKGHSWLNANIVGTGSTLCGGGTAGDNGRFVAPSGRGCLWRGFGFRRLPTVLVETLTFVTDPSVV